MNCLKICRWYDLILSITSHKITLILKAERASVLRWTDIWSRFIDDVWPRHISWYSDIIISYHRVVCKMSFNGFSLGRMHRRIKESGSLRRVIITAVPALPVETIFGKLFSAVCVLLVCQTIAITPNFAPWPQIILISIFLRNNGLPCWLNICCSVMSFSKQTFHTCIGDTFSFHLTAFCDKISRIQSDSIDSSIANQDIRTCCWKPP